MRSFGSLVACHRVRLIAAQFGLGVAALASRGYAQAPPNAQGVAPGVVQPPAPPPTATAVPIPPAPGARVQPGLNPVRPAQGAGLPGTGTSGGGVPAGAGRRAPGQPAPAAPTGLPDAPRAVIDEMTALTPGGLTAEQVGQRAAATSYQAKAAEQAATAASAREDQQWASYLPRLGLLGRYTRFSSFTPPSLGQNQTVGTQAAPGTVNPTPTIAIENTRFPLVLNQYLLQATIAIPISDYFLRIGKAHSAAIQSTEAARFDIIAARLKSYADGKIAYFTWLRARGATVVAEQSLAVARSHLRDSESQFGAGGASKVDVLRAQTQVAAAELGVERAKSGVSITDRQVRVAIHAREDEVLAPAESLEVALPPLSTNLKTLVAEANLHRAELKSIEKSAEAARKLADVARAGRYPVLSAFGDVTYANPNPRVFPQRPEFSPTWAAGAQVTWSPSDLLVANASGSDAEARAAALDAQRSAVRDGVEIEVTQAYQAALEADAAILTTQRQLESALEGYRVARELFSSGRGTATTLIDSEIVLAQSRFEHLNALVDARLGRIRLDYAIGRQASPATAAR